MPVGLHVVRLLSASPNCRMPVQCQQLQDQARVQQRPVSAMLSLQAGRQCRLRGQQGPALQQKGQCSMGLWQ